MQEMPVGLRIGRSFSGQMASERRVAWDVEERSDWLKLIFQIACLAWSGTFRVEFGLQIGASEMASGFEWVISRRFGWFWNQSKALQRMVVKVSGFNWSRLAGPHAYWSIDLNFRFEIWTWSACPIADEPDSLTCFSAKSFFHTAPFRSF